MLGIEQIKTDLTIITKVCNVVNNSLSDGKIQINEWWTIAKESVNLLVVVKTYKGALNELKDLSEDELKEINLHFQNEFDIDNDKAEQLIEGAINVIVSIACLIV